MIRMKSLSSDNATYPSRITGLPLITPVVFDEDISVLFMLPLSFIQIFI
jgi:hypothetical protein